MKIAFVTSPTSSEQMYGGWDLSQVDTYCPPLGVLYIASLLRKNNHIPYVIDVPALKWSLKETVSYVLSLNPDVVGISSMTINIHNAGKIAEELKGWSIKAPIILGGAHITAAPVETLRNW